MVSSDQAAWTLAVLALAQLARNNQQFEDTVVAAVFLMLATHLASSGPEEFASLKMHSTALLAVGSVAQGNQASKFAI